MTYRSALIGMGGRAQQHAAAYSKLRNMQIVAGADPDAARREKFAKDFRVPITYADAEAMLAAEKPDVVHLVTNPNVRVEPVRACAKHGVKAMIIEKPLGLALADGEAIEKIARDSGMKVIVNTQRRYFPTVVALCDLLRSGRAGRVEFIRAHSISPVFCTGSHTLDMIEAFLGDADPVHVWATAYGESEYHSTHPGPHSFLSSITFPNRVQVLYEASKEGAGIHGTDEFFFATRFDIVCERGRFWWTEVSGWGYQLDGMEKPERFPTNFLEEDKIGQALFTQGVANWLDDPGKPHGNRLENGLRVFRTIGAMVQSAVENRRVEFDPTKLRDTAGELRQRIEGAERNHPEKQAWKWAKPPR